MLIRLSVLLESKQRTVALEDFTIRRGEHDSNGSCMFIYLQESQLREEFLSFDLTNFSEEKEFVRLSKGRRVSDSSHFNLVSC